MTDFDSIAETAQVAVMRPVPIIRLRTINTPQRHLFAITVYIIIAKDK